MLKNLNSKAVRKSRPKSAVRSKKEKLCEKLKKVVQDTRIDMEFLADNSDFVRYEIDVREEG